jgi:hypothetical protein
MKSAAKNLTTNPQRVKSGEESIVWLFETTAPGGLVPPEAKLSG